MVCNCYPDIVPDIDEQWTDYTGNPEWHSVYTIQLGELVQSGVFDWSKPELDWSSVAFDQEQYERVCTYFIKRFYWREISLLPILQWMNILQYRLVYELMPKYKPLYERIAQGYNPLAEKDDYYKERKITSAYPETVLSGNSDYITDGIDTEHETIHEGSIVDATNKYMIEFQAIDKALLDACEDLFTCMYSANVNGL